MSWRRVVFAFAVTFVCALTVFTLPRFVFNTVSGAVRQTPAQDTAKAQPVPAAPVQPTPRSLGSRLTGLFGIILILGIGFAFSRNRRAISWRVVAWGVGLQAVFAIFVLRVPIGQEIFSWLGATVTKILSFSYAGSEFVFGEIGKQHSSIGVVFAFQIMPAIIFVSALFAIMYYLGIMQIVVKAFAIAMNKIMGASGAESLNVAASIFMGQTEAPLTIRPFLPRMTISELMTVMTAGMAHVSGSIMAAYIAFGIEARHLLTAVIMTAPGTIMMAKIIEPETEVPDARRCQGRDPTHRRERTRRRRARHERRLAADAQRDRDAHLVHRAHRARERAVRMDPWIHVVVPHQPPDRARLDFPADRICDGRTLARQRDGRRAAG